MKKHIISIIIRLLTGIFIFICAILLFFFGALYMLYHGPYPKTKALFVNTVMETSAAKFMAQWYLSDEAIAGINAGGFLDPGGDGDGGTPDGLIIQNGIWCI